MTPFDVKKSGFTLRVSVLEHCQLRCSYCLPPKNKIKSLLTLEDYVAITNTLKGFFISKIRFTGGEPLLRADLPQIIAIFKQSFPNVVHAVTTNGIRFVHMSKKLVDCGLDGITFHLDTLKNERYENLMGRGDVKHVMESIDLAQKLGFKIKINCVVQKGLNDDEIEDFISVFSRLNIEVRFIELMDTGSAPKFIEKHFMTGAQILNKISNKYEIEELERETPDAPSERFYIRNLNYYFGLIASDTRSFCKNCNRIRLSSDGMIRTCLYEKDGLKIDFHSMENQGDAIAQKIRNKVSFHPLGNKTRRIFSMSETGG